MHYMKEPWLTILSIIGVVLGIFVFMIVTRGFDATRWFRPVESVESKYPEYQRLVQDANHAGFQELQVIVPTDNRTNDKISRDFFDGLTKSYQYSRAEAKITDAYLLFEGYVNGNATSGETLYPDDSLYFKINDFGGHVIATQGKVDTPQEPGMTRLMFDLGNMAFYKSAANKAAKSGAVMGVDFINFLNTYALPPHKANIFSAIVSSRPTTKIIRLSIFYKMAQEGDSINKM